LTTPQTAWWGIWPLKSICLWGDAGKYKASATAFADSETFEYLLPLSGDEVVPASGHAHQRGLLGRHFLACPLLVCPLHPGT